MVDIVKNEQEYESRVKEGIYEALKSGTSLDSRAQAVIDDLIPGAKGMDDEQLRQAAANAYDYALSMDLRGSIAILAELGGGHNLRIASEQNKEPAPSKIAAEKKRQDETVVEYAARAIEQGKVPEGQVAQMLQEKLPDAATLEPDALRKSISNVIEDAKAMELRGTLFLMGQLARSGGAKGLG